jgi:hypothetical protein
MSLLLDVTQKILLEQKSVYQTSNKKCLDCYNKVLTIQFFRSILLARKFKKETFWRAYAL